MFNKYNMSNYKGLLYKFSSCLIIVFLCNLLTPTFVAYGATDISSIHKEPADKNVLVLTSYSSSNSFEATMTNYLIKNVPDANFAIENLSLLNRNQSYLYTQANLLSEKYANMNFDLIIALNDEALKFIGKYHSILVNNVPVIFGGINQTSILSQYPYNNYTGIMESPNVPSLLDLIIDLHPSSPVINIISDDSLFSLSIENSIRSLIPCYTDSLKFNFIKGTSIDVICEKLSSSHLLQPIIIMGSFTDSNGNILRPDEVILKIKDQCSCPIYTFDSDYINSKIVGGCILDTKTHSKFLSDLVNKQLSSNDIIKVPPVYDNNNIFTFNYDELRRLNIARKSLPENSIILNSPWLNINMLYIFIAITLVILLISVIAFQKINNKRNTIAQKIKYDEVVNNDRLKTEFIANFSHELRTLLNIMLSGLQLLDCYVKSGDITFKNPDQEEKLSYVRQSGLRLLKLINNIIDLSRLENGFFNVNLDNKNIVQVLEDISLSVVDYANSKNIELIFDTNEEEFFMYIDVEKMDRIMLNLLSNAIKFTPDNGTILVTLTCNESSITVSVKDSGIGIPKEKQHSIFNRFTQVNSSLSRSGEGSGIGLSLVKCLIDLLGGSIHLKSEPLEGCDFIFTIPVKNPDTLPEEVSSLNHNLQTNSDKIIIELSDINKY